MSIPATAKPLNDRADEGTIEENGASGAVENKNETAPAQNGTLCVACEVNHGKYKCTKCLLAFCSVSCGKLHKQTHAGEPELPKQISEIDATKLNNTPPTQSNPPASTPTNRFSVLEQDPRMGQLFLKYPDLEDQLAIIEKAYRPPSYEERLRTGWTTETGKAQGMKALRDARNKHAGVAEYSELVTMLMSGNDAGPTPTEHAEKDEIRRLMALEGQ